MKKSTESKGIPNRNFRKPILEEFNYNSPLNLSTVGDANVTDADGDDITDFDVYNAVKLLVLSGGVNVIDTAINYRCQKAERSIGAALNTLFNKYGI